MDEEELIERRRDLNQLSFNQKISIAALILPVIFGLISFYFSINNQFVKMNIDIANIEKNISTMSTKIQEIDNRVSQINLTLVKQCEQINNVKDRIKQANTKNVTDERNDREDF